MWFRKLPSLTLRSKTSGHRCSGAHIPCRVSEIKAAHGFSCATSADKAAKTALITTPALVELGRVRRHVSTFLVSTEHAFLVPSTSSWMEQARGLPCSIRA